jgi:hypothetical protein
VVWTGRGGGVRGVMSEALVSAATDGAVSGRWCQGCRGVGGRGVGGRGAAAVSEALMSAADWRGGVRGGRFGGWGGGVRPPRGLETGGAPQGHLFASLRLGKDAPPFLYFFTLLF